MEGLIVGSKESIESVVVGNEDGRSGVSINLLDLASTFLMICHFFKYLIYS